MFSFIYHCCHEQMSRLNKLEYESWVVNQIVASRRLCNWEAVDILQGFLCDAVIAKYQP